MTSRFHANLATRPFRRYRAVNLALAGALVVGVLFGLWQIRGFGRYSDALSRSRENEREARAQWSFLGDQIREIEDSLERPEIAAEIQEVEFLNTILERKRFSWNRLLRELEASMPREVYIVSLTPQIGDDGNVMLSMEARGRSVAALTTFLANLEAEPSFENVRVSIEEVGEVQGQAERRMMTEVDYRPVDDVAEAAQR